MTHFIGAVVVPATIEYGMQTERTKFPTLYGKDAKEWVAGSALNDYLEKALEKFYEGKDTPRYVEYTRDEAIAKSRQEVKEYAESGPYAKYLADPEGYAKSTSNEQHLAYLRDEFPLRLNWTDDEHFKNTASWYDEDDIDADGNLYSTYNPHSKWDWWVIGGRWEDIYAKRQGETVEDFAAELRAKIADMKDPELQAELAEVEAYIKSVRDEFNRQRKVVQDWYAAHPEASKGTYEQNLPLALAAQAGDDAPSTSTEVVKPITWDDMDAAERKRLDCRAYSPWWTPYNIVVPTKVRPDPTESNEVVFDIDGEEVLVDDFEWVTKGRMGWFGMSDDDMDELTWLESLVTGLENLNPKDRIVYIDFHI